MLYRALTAAIVLFWLGMMGSLVRSEWFAGEPSTLTVPTAYLWKLVFLHEEASDLVVYNGREKLGNLHLQPHRQATGTEAGRPTRLLTMVGGFNSDLPWFGRTNVVLHGTLEMDEENTARQIRFSAVLHVPGQPKNGLVFNVDGDPPARQWHYVVQRNDETLFEDAGTIEQLLDRPEVRALGIDLSTLLRAQQDQVFRASVVARRGRLRLNKDEIDTFVVTIKDVNGLENTLHLNQLGQVLAVRTFAGISLLDDGVEPLNPP